MYAAIHHGGSGTTHLALRYGCPTMIIPHVVDQFVWNRIVYEKGAGPKGISVGKIRTKNLEPKIIDLMGNPTYKKNADMISKQMMEENHTENLYRSIIQ